MKFLRTIPIEDPAIEMAYTLYRQNLISHSIATVTGNLVLLYDEDVTIILGPTVLEDGCYNLNDISDDIGYTLIDYTVATNDLREKGWAILREWENQDSVVADYIKFAVIDVVHKILSALGISLTAELRFFYTENIEGLLFVKDEAGRFLIALE